jgi:hypothetical protein
MCFYNNNIPELNTSQTKTSARRHATPRKIGDEQPEILLLNIFILSFKYRP